MPWHKPFLNRRMAHANFFRLTPGVELTLDPQPRLASDQVVPDSGLDRIVIIGGGFGGLELAKHLDSSRYQIVLLDKNNHHTFQPLLYQVATGGLEPDSIATPLRKIFRKAADRAGKEQRLPGCRHALFPLRKKRRNAPKKPGNPQQTPL